MTSEQTPRDVLIAHQRLDISSCCCGWGELGKSFCQHQIDALDAAGFAIVPKPTGDAIDAACYAYVETEMGSTASHATCMAAALAAGAAADGRTPDEPERIEAGYQAVRDMGRFSSDARANAWMWRRVDAAIRAALGIEAVDTSGVRNGGS